MQRPPPEPGAPDPSTQRVEVPHERLTPAALDRLVEEFVTRSGTDYGEVELSLEHKKDAVLRQLRRGEVVIVYEVATESCNLVTRDDLRRLERA